MAKTKLDPKFLPLIEGRRIASLATLSPDGSPHLLRIHRRYLSEAAIAEPQVGGVFAQFDDVTLKLQPRVWTWWDMSELDAMYFGGRFGNTPGYLLPQEI